MVGVQAVLAATVAVVVNLVEALLGVLVETLPCGLVGVLLQVVVLALAAVPILSTQHSFTICHLNFGMDLRLSLAVSDLCSHSPALLKTGSHKIE